MAGLENADLVQQTLIHINELDAEQPIEAELVTTLESPGVTEPACRTEL